MFRGPVEGKHQAASSKQQAASTKHKAQQHTCCALTRTLSAQRWTSNNWPHIGCTRHTHTHVCASQTSCASPRLAATNLLQRRGNYPRNDGTFGTFGTLGHWDIWDIGILGHLGHLGHWDKPTSNKEMEDLAFHWHIMLADRPWSLNWRSN